MEGVSDDALADGFIVPVTCGALPSLETSEASWYEQPETAMNDRMAAMGFIAIGRARQSHRHRRGAAVPLSLYKCRRHHSRPSHTSTLVPRTMSDAAPIKHPTGLTSGDFTEAEEPLRLFAAWFADAKQSEPVNPEAMALATVDARGLPNARMVLLKGFDERGFVFYSSAESIKGHELAAAPKAALTFYWKSLQRQVRVRGQVETVLAAEADAYFASRSRMAQIGAWASKQSTALESRLAFEKAIARFTAKFAVGAVPRPTYWVGYRVAPQEIEFWQERPFRLHDRVAFTRADPTAPWIKTRLYP